MTWQPVVTDPLLKNVILKKTEEISRLIEAHHRDFSKPGLFDGDAGLCLFFCYLDKFQNTAAHAPIINELIASSFNSINNGFEYSTFCSGISGVLWNIHHLSREGFIDTDDYFEELTPFIEQRMFDYAAVNNIDFLHGANGLGFYLLQHSDKVNPSTFDYLVESLMAKGIIENETIKWESTVNIKTQQKAFNISLSHGISSIIIFLSTLLEKFPEHKRAADLLTKSLNFLLLQKNKGNEISLFPGYIETEQTPQTSRHSRLSWCYGDLGIARALDKAGTVLKRPDLTGEAIAIMKHAAKRRDLEQNRVIDTAICHGTAGIAHMFNRFYQQTGLPEFKDAAVYWIEKTMDMASQEDGFAGYKTYKGTEEGWKNELNLLNGISGIGLVLMSTISDVEPKWDRCLLLS